MFSLIPIAHAAEEAGIHVALKPYILGELFGVPITATLVTTWLTMLILIVGAYYFTSRPTLIPKKIQSIVEMIVGGIYDYMSDVLESRKLALKYFPVVTTIFVFVLALNWTGLLPGVTSIGFTYDGYFTPLFYPAATDLNITIAFAIVAFLTIEIAGVVALGLFKYAGKFFNFKSPLAFIIGIIELISELARLVSFSFRLFGNIFAGKTLLVVVMFFVPYILPVPLYAFEVFVGFIQAFVFAILTLFFIKIAVAEPH
jgi:F-type H+-transporting ATPase subunit a